VPEGVRVHERLQLLQSCLEALRERAGAEPVVVGVDGGARLAADHERNGFCGCDRAGGRALR
jgi:hypothetical protein